LNTSCTANILPPQPKATNNKRFGGLSNN